MMRKTGYYWVKLPGYTWEVADWDSYTGRWMLHGSEVGLSDDGLAEIDERRIVRKDDLQNEKASRQQKTGEIE